jgi:hypothetical protein
MAGEASIGLNLELVFQFGSVHLQRSNGFPEFLLFSYGLEVFLP